jgi:diguanylate cyclase
MTKALQHLADHAWKILALLPLLALLAVQLGGEAALAGLAVALPLAVLAFGRKGGPADSGAMSDQVIARLDATLAEVKASGGTTGCLVIQFDDAAHLCDRLGRARQSEVLSACVARLRGALRPGDLLYTLEDGSLAVALAASPRLDLEIMVRIAARLQLVAQQPVTLATGPVQVTCSINNCRNPWGARFWMPPRSRGMKRRPAVRARSAASRPSLPGHAPTGMACVRALPGPSTAARSGPGFSLRSRPTAAR